MKRLSTFFFGLIVPLMMLAQGWPSNYGGVMLQGFYWDSHADSKWTVLERQADELSKFFDIIWVPFSGNCQNDKSMGYNPVWWFDNTSGFGNEAELRSMIQAYKKRGTVIMEDVVLNHKGGVANWCDFATEHWNGNEISWTLADICANDDGGDTRNHGFNVSGKDDEGDDFKGLRDLDHTSGNVQKNIKLYLDYLLNDLGYGGFRYDMVKGYAAYYVGMYNASAKPKFSVGEYWDGDAEKVKGWITGPSGTSNFNQTIQSAAFDFPLKNIINNHFNSNNFTNFYHKGLAGKEDINRYSVTFVDNHDTYRDDNRLKNNVLAANAFILALPGTPCIFLPHWQAHKEELKKMIMARKAAGITNQSKVYDEQKGNGSIITTQGLTGSIKMIAGYVTDADLNGYTLISTGTSENPNYAFYLSNNIVSVYNTLMATQVNIADGASAEKLLTYDANEHTVYFANNQNWAEVYAWAWDGNSTSTNYTGGKWPGTKCTKTDMKTKEGYEIWKWTYTGTMSDNSKILFNIGSNTAQTSNQDFINGGYYNAGGLTAEETTAINSLIDRNFTAGQRSTICLPFNLSAEELKTLNGKVYELESENSGVLSFREVDALEAYKPYVFVANETGKGMQPLKNKEWLKGNPITVTKGNFSFKGTMEKISVRPIAPTNYFAYNAADGRFVKAGKEYGISVKPTVCYFYSNSDAHAKQMVLEDKVSNAIATIEVETTGDNATYNIAGQRVDANYKGIVIRNGKKFVNR